MLQPTVLFAYSNELEIPVLADSETDPTKNHQDNDTTPPLGTKSSSSHSPLEDILVAPEKPHICTHVKVRDAALQVRLGDLPDMCLLGSYYMLFGVYQYWLHQNPVNHLDGGIT